MCNGYASCARKVVHRQPSVRSAGTSRPRAHVVAYVASPDAAGICGQRCGLCGGLATRVGAPVVQQRFDTAGDVFDLAELDKTVGAYFGDRDPSRCFAADSVMQLSV